MFTLIFSVLKAIMGLPGIKEYLENLENLDKLDEKYPEKYLDKLKILDKRLVSASNNIDMQGKTKFTLRSLFSAANGSKAAMNMQKLFKDNNISKGIVGMTEKLAQALVKARDDQIENDEKEAERAEKVAGVNAWVRNHMRHPYITDPLTRKDQSNQGDYEPLLKLVQGKGKNEISREAAKKDLTIRLGNARRE